MTRIRYHSDCDYFGGCENMLVNLFSGDGLDGGTRVSFSYRASVPYEKGLGERVARPPELIPLGVLDFHQASAVSNAWPAPLRIVYKVLLRLLLVKYWIFLWDVAVLYRSFGPEPIDILHINNGGFPGAVSCLAAAPAGRLRGIKKIVHVVNNMAVPYDGPDRWLDRPMDLLAANCVDVFVTGSETARRSLVRVLDLPEDRVVSLANGIAPRALGEEPAALRLRLGLPAGRPLIAVVAVLERRKGHRVLLEALGRLKAEGFSPMPVVALGGDGPLRGELERQARENGLQDEVLFLGWVSDHFSLFNAADVVALPSIGYEDFPNVTLEAMSLGKAVLATRVGGVEEQLVDGESGLLAAPGSVEELAGALSRLLGDPALRQRLGARARTRFEERFTDSAAVERYRALYGSLLSARPANGTMTKS
jgi:glycosyltransferase involved in cell wall biosynthesis